MAYLKFEKHTEITKELVDTFFSYDPETGIFRRIKRLKPRPGGSDGTLKDCDWVLSKPSKGGYIHTGIGNRYVAIHILIWIHMTGKKCSNQIDHIDGDRTNNKWSNLREVDCVENCCNGGLRINNSTGVMGVSKTKWGNYLAQIQKHGRKLHIGHYATLEEATKARLSYEADLGFHPNHGKRLSCRKSKLKVAISPAI